MKSLYESIIGNTNIGAAYYKKYINDQPLTNYPDITFKDFLNNVSDEILIKQFKTAFSDANKMMSKGVVELYFKDGALGVEIMTMKIGTHTDKWWRQAFIKNEDIKPGKPLTTYYYQKQYGRTNEINTFTTHWGDRLKNVIHDYIDFLKKNYDVLMKSAE